MKIKILQFKILETHVLREGFWTRLQSFFLGTEHPPEYHFEIQIQIDPWVPMGPDLKWHSLEPQDQLELPGHIRLEIFRVARDILMAKTTRFIPVDLRRSKPMEAYLVYPRP
jgi:hypothetical protein